MNNSWSSSKKILFRFCFVFFILIILIQNNGAYPFWYYIWMIPEQIFAKLVPWLGKEVLGIKYIIGTEPSGSGDTTYDWLKLLFILILSSFGSFFWGIFSKPTKNYDKLYYYLTLAVRYYIGFMLISYGLVKVFKLQFPAPNLYRLSQEYGDSSPMGLAWTFLGFSKGYNLFMGIAEICSIFLLFRRTLAIGSIITLMTTMNVMMINYFYDVPVKQISTILVVFTIFLLAYNFEELFNLFVRNQTTQLSIIKQPIFTKNVKLFFNVSKYILLFFAFFFVAFELSKEEKKDGDDAPKSKIVGKYSVKNLNQIKPDDLKTIFISNEYSAWARFANGKNERFSLNYDNLKNTIIFNNRTDSTDKFTFKYFKKNKKLAGKFRNDTFEIVLEKENITKKYLLETRGFHWVNETPFNR